MENLNEILAKNPYPGRGIVIGKNKNGNAIIIYFIMGRSDNSRNRVFIEKDGGIITKAADEAKLLDPSLIIYAPVKVLKAQTVVTNGNQTDTIIEALKKGESFANALRTRTFEPDEPNYTPRISGLLVQNAENFSYKLSILKTNNGNALSAQKFFYEYDEPLAGEGHFIHTYKKDNNYLPSFEGEPIKVQLGGNIDEIANNVWQNLDNNNKVALFVREIAPNSSEQTRILNKYTKV